MSYNGVPIIVSAIYPPIPTRNFDYSAHLDGQEESGRYGFGRSESIAVADLIQTIWEMDRINL